MKIRFSRPLVGLALVSVLGISALAQLQDGPPVDFGKLRKELATIKHAQDSTSKGLVSKVIHDFSSAAASNAAAIAFYQSALMATKNQSANDVQDMSKMEVIQTAARIHLNYLVLTIQHALGATTKQLEPALSAHIANVLQAGANDGVIWMRREKARQLADQGNRSANAIKGRMAAEKEPMFCEQKLITESVENSVFVQWYGIQKLLSNSKDGAADSRGGGEAAKAGASDGDWTMTPGDIDGIYQSTLLPYYRQIKDPRALAYWDQKIATEGQKANASTSAFTIDQFNRIQRPQYLWSRAKDEIAIGLRNKGIADMLELVKACPDHPDVEGWISELEGIAQPAAPSAASPSPQATGGQ